MKDSGPDPVFDAYKVLQVDPEADPEVIQAAFRRLAQKWHPDRLVTDDPGRADAATRMVTINRAWALLGDPGRREAYDRERARAGDPTRAVDQQTDGHARGSAAQHRTAADPPTPREPERVSRDWTTGRSSSGYTYEPSMRTADGEGAAGSPPGRPSGSVLNFGRYAGWSLGEIARGDLEYVEWLDRMPIGRPYREEIDAILRRAGRRQSADSDATGGRGLFRRR